MAVASTVTIRLDGDSAKLVRELNKANRKTKTFASRSVRNLKKVTGQLTRVGAVAAIALAVLAKSAFKAGDELAKTADKLGIATDKLAGLRLAGELTGVATNQLDLGLQRFTRRLAEASKGIGEAQGALKELGINAKEVSQLPLDEQFRRVADAMADVEGQSDKIRLGFKLFDSEGVNLIRTLALTRKGLDEVQERAQTLGIAITRVDAAKLEIVNDRFLLLKKSAEGFGLQFAIVIAPALQLLTEKIGDAIEEAGGLNQVLSGVIPTVSVMVAGLNNAFLIVKAIILGISSAVIILDEVGQVFLRQADSRINALRGTLTRSQSAIDAYTESQDALTGGTGEAKNAVDGLINTVISLGSAVAGFAKKPIINESEIGKSAALTARLAEIKDSLADVAAAFLSSEDIKKSLDEAFAVIEAEAKRRAGIKTETELKLFDVEQSKRDLQTLADLQTQNDIATAQRRLELDATTKQLLLFNEQQQQSAITEIALAEAQARVERQLAIEAAVRQAAGLDDVTLTPEERAKRVAAAVLAVVRELNAALAKESKAAADLQIEHAQMVADVTQKLREDTANLALGLLRSFAGKSKAAAIAAIALEKGLAIAKTVMNTAAAVMKAYSIDPTGVLAARVALIGKIQVGIIAATGLAQAAAVGGGGAALGTPANPVFGTDVDDQAGAGGNDPFGFQGGTGVTVIFQGDVFGWDEHIRERVISGLREALDEHDEIIFGSGSAQALAVIGGDT